MKRKWNVNFILAATVYADTSLHELHKYKTRALRSDIGSPVRTF